MSLPLHMQRFQEVADAVLLGKHQDVDLTCPHCTKPSLVYSYAFNRRRNGCSLYVACKECKRYVHFNLGFDRVPPTYKEELVLSEFQKIEDEIVKQMDEQDEAQSR